MRASGDLDINALDFFTVNFSDYFTNNRTMLGLALLAASALASDTTPKLGCGLTSSRVLDRVAATPPPYPRTWFWDNLHVLSILNEHYNDMLWHAIQD